MKNLIQIYPIDNFQISKQKETIVLIHGFLCSSQIWNNLISKLQNSYTIFFVDLPGHNSDSNSISSIGQLAEEIATELYSQQLLNAHLIGHSLGGYIAGEINKQNIITIKSITLLNSTLLADSALKKKDRELAIRAVKITPTIFTQNVIEKLFLEDNRISLKDEIQKIQNISKTITQKTIISYLQAMKNRNATIEFIKGTPLHFVSSIQDTTIPFESISQQVKETNAHLTLLHKSNHMSFLEESEVVAESIHSFFISLNS